MVSFQTPDSTNHHSSKKRKWDEPQPRRVHSNLHLDLHLEFPLPSDWQRCLDIQSGEIHFYNTRTHKRTKRDPRFNEVSPLLNLELELNIANGDHHNTPDKKKPSTNNMVASLAAADIDQQEMLAAACKRCHLLVMFCKSYPACPNCKFVHPTDQGSQNLPKPRLSLLC